MYVLKMFGAGLLATCIMMSAALAQLAPKRIVPDSGEGTIIVDLTHPRGTNNAPNIYEL